MKRIDELIAKIRELKRFDMWGTETEGSVEITFCSDGSLVDADDLYKILEEFSKEEVRQYSFKLKSTWKKDCYTVEEWMNPLVQDYWLDNGDGSGYWVKDGFRSNDEVFSTPQLDATHVIWFSK